MPKQRNPLEHPASVSSPDEGGADRTEKDIEAEAAVDTGSTERRKIEIPADMDAHTIQERFKVSRTTAWRAKKQGWLFKNYHEKTIIPDISWATAHEAELRQSAKEGAQIALARLGRSYSELKPFNFEDLVAEGYVRLVELSGNPDRESKFWRNTVARNVVFDFVKTQIISAGKVFISEEYDETKNRIKR